ncbi:ABC transporter ATP-binding protein [Edaphobacter modestus]|uniref:Putative ABC transport system ATP-binding protein n=1 Tax=Edaphobacter modestus TaxID=388466 RepID=A0A4Q7YNU1_9BACT|nr:ABC transporter ATP-binding protein [Edaphobacter modestus]RZU39018.1 putative ABC transport system ATP-binding protein [Edaphobacter modestus]
MFSAVVMQDVSFGYEAHAPIMQVKEFNIEKGKRVFLHGSSGSGKTTLLGLIAGVLLPQHGTCEVLGKELTHLSLSARDRHRGSEMGYIFQSFNLIPYLSVKENIELPCRVHAKRLKRIAAPTLGDEVRRIAERLDLHHYLDRGVTKLSTGQQQRVAIARAVIGRPRLVIADEPTSSLDSDRQEAFLQLLLEVCDEARATLIFVSHDRSLMSHFDERISIAEINQVRS